MADSTWTYIVLCLAVLSLVRPLIILVRRQGGQITAYRQAIAQAGNGAVMLAVAAYLMLGATEATGRGFWDLALAAWNAPFMLSLPEVWVPPLCWVLLVIAGARMLYRGVRDSRGPRDSKIALWALNEIAICGALLWWSVHVSDGWTLAAPANFALRGFYFCIPAGSCIRFVLVMFGTGGDDRAQLYPGSKDSWVGRFRRF